MVIVITGGTSGLGKALKEKFENRGDTVVVLARSAVGENAIKCDVSVKSEVESAFAEIKNKYGKIDILVNNAGYGLAGVTELLPEEEVRKIFDVNFFGVLFCIQSALHIMNFNGKIINISSACAIFALPYRGLYCASKSAVSMLSDSLRLELKRTGIQVTAICPGNIMTNFSKNRVKFADTNEKYGDSLQKATEKIDKEAHKRMSLDLASAKIFKIIDKKKLKAQYIVGKKYKFLYFLSKILPKSWIAWGTTRFAKTK